jgi:iron(III) transport system ATP-binding protein
VHQRDALVLLVRELADERGIATILVTHDRDEALALADEILVMREGRIVERGAATSLLQAPQSAFAAAFLAGAACLPVEGARTGFVATPFGEIAARGTPGALRLVLMPGDLEATPPVGNGPRAHAIATVPHGDAFLVRASVLGQIVAAHSAVSIRPGDEVELRLRRPLRVLPWDAATLP